MLWLWLGLGMGKIGADLRLESNIREEWSKRVRGTREKRLERDREWVERERRDKSKWGNEKWVT